MWDVRPAVKVLRRVQRAFVPPRRWAVSYFEPLTSFAMRRRASETAISFRTVSIFLSMSNSDGNAGWRQDSKCRTVSTLFADLGGHPFR